MTKNVVDPKEARECRAAEPRSQPGSDPTAAGVQTSPEALWRQILELRKSGDDPAKLWKLEAAFDEGKLREINALLAERQQQDREALEVAIRVRSEMVKRFAAQSQRTDLTLREVQMLQRVESKVSQDNLKWLLNEKRRLMQKRLPTKGA